MTKEQRIFMAVGKALVKTVRERFPVSSNIESLFRCENQQYKLAEKSINYLKGMLKAVRLKKKEDVTQNNLSRANVC